MAAPTAPRVYAIGQGQNRIKWTYTGGSDVKVYRSTDGASYSSVATVSPGTTGTYDDSGLADKTKYWYKLTDDNGSTFSSVVTVVTYIPVSRRQGAGSQYIATGGPYDLQVLQDKLDGESVQSQPCDVCIVDQAIVLDCTNGCTWFRVVLDGTDINSISLLGCDDCPSCDFIVPPGETHSVCGWPMGCDFFGDECYNASIPGGTNGRTAKTNGLSYDGYGPSPVNMGPCCPAGFLTLSVQCCSDDCTLTCS